MKIVAIDIGTTKICVFIAQLHTSGTIELIGLGKVPSEGMARGVVVDIHEAARSISQAVKEAERAAGCRVESAVIGISGSHIQSYLSTGVVTVRSGIVQQQQVDEVLSMAKMIALPQGQQILHTIASYYIVDGHEQVLDPRFLSAARLEVYAQVITGAVGSVHNLVRCTEIAGIKVKDVILEPLASAAAVLSPDERQLGVGLLDIGGGTADFALYHKGSLRHTKVFPIAGNLFTNDIGVILRIQLPEAERIKHELARYGLHADGSPHEIWHATGIDGLQQVAVEPLFVQDIVNARLQELTTMIYQECATHHLYAQMPAGIVVTGGGSLLRGLSMQMQSQLGIPVRCGIPRVPDTCQSIINHPLYATGYGLLLLGAHQELDRRAQPLLRKFVPSNLLSRMRSWIYDAI